MFFRIPEAFSKALENVCRRVFVNECEKCEIEYFFLFMVFPKYLMEHQIPVYQVIQRVDDILVVGPCVSHGVQYLSDNRSGNPRFVEYGKRDENCYYPNISTLKINKTTIIRDFQPEKYNNWKAVELH